MWDRGQGVGMEWGSRARYKRLAASAVGCGACLRVRVGDSGWGLVAEEVVSNRDAIVSSHASTYAPGSHKAL